MKKLQKFKWGGTHQFFLHPFLSSFTPELKGKTILDVGCGKGINGYLIRVTRDLEGATLVGIDLNSEFLEFCSEHKIYDSLVKHKLPKLPFPDKSVDFLLCTEVIEHLTKKEGIILLKEIDRVCKERAIVSTPNIFFKAELNEDADVHRSLWTVDDFEKFDYRVRGLGFRTALLPKDPLFRLKQAMYYLATPFSFLIPEVGGILLCIKDY